MFRGWMALKNAWIPVKLHRKQFLQNTGPVFWVTPFAVPLSTLAAR
jgi:hypothetical protein